jgi:hypothetical protein
MLPFFPEEKSNQAIFWSLTKKLGVFSDPKGDRPFHFPARLHQLDAAAHDVGNGEPRLDVVEKGWREAHGTHTYRADAAGLGDESGAAPGLSPLSTGRG